MRQLLFLAILSTLAPLSSAEVIRCADAAGNVSYTDGTCPPGARPVGRVSEPPPALRDGAERQREERGPMAATPNPSQAPAGPAIIDSRGASSNERPGDSRWSERGSDPVAIDDGYPYPGTYRQPMPRRDMRPRIRNCDAAGCQDTQGNHYNRSGQLDRYQTPDGKTCRPVGTTTICR
ncbi:MULTISPECIES: DUF4124 domain-containing protein [unclassified Variovorax]|uniref:DUF4124 domain-containing protein n=1 Tax=unclassified Variovorax TaxID=663243 RepID=UPI003ECE4574